MVVAGDAAEEVDSTGVVDSTGAVAAMAAVDTVNPFDRRPVSYRLGRCQSAPRRLASGS